MLERTKRLQSMWKPNTIIADRIPLGHDNEDRKNLTVLSFQRYKNRYLARLVAVDLYRFIIG